MKSFRFAIAWLLTLNLGSPLRAQNHNTAFDGGPSNPNTVVDTTAANNLALNQALQQSNLDYQAQGNDLRSELERATLAKNQCTTAQNQEDIANKINAAQEAGAQKGQMVQQLMPTIGAMAQQLPKLASKEGKAAKDTMTALEQEGGADNRFHILKKNVGQSVRFAADEGACEEEFVGDKAAIETCINRADRRASQMNEQYAQAKRDAAGSGDLMGPLLTAGLAGAALAYGNSVRTQTAAITGPLQAQLSEEKRAACLAEADLAIADVNRRMAQLQKNRDFALSQIASQFKLPRSVIDNLNVPVIDPLSTNNNNPGGALAAAAGGAGLVPYVPPFTKDGAGGAPAGGASGGGGGGGGGASGGSDLAWTYGQGGGAAGGGSIPAQPGESSFEGGGGASVFAAAGPASAEGGLNMGLEVPGPGQEQQGSFAVGDGGIRLMMARARMRLSNHQTELLRDLDLRTMAKSSSEEPNREVSSLKNKP